MEKGEDSNCIVGEWETATTWPLTQFECGIQRRLIWRLVIGWNQWRIHLAPCHWPKTCGVTPRFWYAICCLSQEEFVLLKTYWYLIKIRYIFLQAFLFQHPTSSSSILKTHLPLVHYQPGLSCRGLHVHHLSVVTFGQASATHSHSRLNFGLEWYGS